MSFPDYDHATQNRDRFAARLGAVLLLVISVCWVASFGVGFVTSLAAITVLGYLLTVLGVFHPTVGFFGIGIACILNPLATRLLFDHPLLRFNSLSYWLLIVMLLALPLVVRLNDIHTRTIQLFVLLLGFQIIMSPTPPRGVQQVLGVMAFFGLVVYYARVKLGERGWFWWGIVNGSVAALGGAAMYLQLASLVYLNPNIWTLMPIGGLFCTCLAAHVVGPHPQRQLVLQALALSCFCLLFLSASRGAMLIGIVGVAFMLTQLPSMSLRLMLGSAAACGALAIAIANPGFAAHSTSRIEKLVDPELTMRQRTSGRAGLAMGGWYIFLENPLGSGTGSFKTEWNELGPDKKHRDLVGSGKNRSAHSAWIRTLAENGLPGILLQLAYTCSFALAGWWRRDKGVLPLGLFVSASLGAAYVPSELNAKAFWLLAAGGTVLLYRDQERQPARYSWPMKRWTRRNETSVYHAPATS